MTATETANDAPGMELIYETLDLVVDGVQLQVSTVRRDGTKAPLVFLHGFGSTKEDYVDLAYHPDFTDRPFLAYDAPGCGATTCSDLSAISIPFLVATAQAILQHHRITQFHLVGHSMGGLTALLLAAAAAPPTSILSFTDIEGNLAPEDCFLSRQIATHHHASPASFLAAFAARAARAPAPASALYAAALPRKVRAGAVRAIFESMVALSDGGGLLRTFLSLPCPAMFMHGDRNAGLTYLPRLAAAGVELAEVPLCAHFPMYSNPVEMWRRIGGFLARVED